MASDGAAEQAWILSQLTPLCGGRWWETMVPDDVTLPIGTDGKVKPYGVVTFGTPFSSNRERGLAQEEDAQPHIMSTSVTVYGASAAAIKPVMTEVRARLIGKQASASSTALRATGGFAYGAKDTGSAPSRVSSTLYLRNTVNLAS